MILIKVCMSVIAGLGLIHRVTSQTPQINTTSKMFNTTLGGSVVLPCVVKNLGGKQVIWTFVDHDTTISKGMEVKVQTNTNKYSIQHPQDSTDAIWNLLISNIQQTDLGHYKCHVDGEVSVSVTHLIRLTGISPTLPPSNNVSDDFNVTECCIKEKVSSACLPVCHPRSIANPLSFNASAVCAFDILGLLKCGSDNKNHAGCCKRRGVPDLCLDYCLGQLPDTITAAHEKCLNNVMDIIACYEDGQGYLPGPPSAVSAVYIKDKMGILVSWSPPTDNANLVIGYRVFYKTQEADLYASTDVLPVNKSESYMIPNVLRDTTYGVYVISVGNNGASQPSVTYQIVTITGSITNSTQKLVKDCCIEKGVSDSCQVTLCSTNRVHNMTIDPNVVMNCYSDINKALQCVTGQRDNSPCCKRNGLPDYCLPLCSGKVPELTWNYTSCVLRFQIIDACVQEGIAIIPGPPVNITLSVGTTTATVTWQPAPGATATSYFVVYEPRDNKMSLDALEIPGNTTETVIDGLKPGTHYELTVAASNDKGSSLPSSKIVFLTYEVIFTTPAPTPTPPGQMPNYNETACCVQKGITNPKCLNLCTYTALTSNISITQGLECVDDLANIIACASDGRDHSECCKGNNVPTECLSFCKFKHGDSLDISQIGCLPNTALIASCYREGVVSLPSPPQNLTVLRVTAHTVTLTWNNKSPVGISSYKVLYTSDLNKPWQLASTSATTYIVNNLKPNTPYYAEVISVNDNGTSASSPRVKFYTLTYGGNGGNCSFMKYPNLSISDSGVNLGNTTLDVCRQACEGTSIQFTACEGFVYGRGAGQCIHYYDKTVFSSKMNSTGYDLYIKKCNSSQVQNTTTNTNWTVTWHNRTDCCMQNNISSDCMPYCKAGDFSNPFKCENDLNALLACATDGRNHTACCQGNGVPTPCLPLCAGHPMEKDATSALCLSYVGVLIACFTDGMGKIPTPPTSFHVVDIGAEYISLRWTKSLNNCGADCVYRVMVIQANGTMTSIMNGTKETSYKLTALKPGTTYVLSIIAINKYGSSLPAVSLSVTTQSSSDVDVVIKQNPSIPEANGAVDMICEVYGPGQYKVMWYFNNKMIKEGRQLTLNSLTPDQEGLYTCTVNGTSKTYNKTRFLQIKYKPKVVNPKGDSQVVNSDKIGTLSCEFYGLPDKVTWLKDGKDVNMLKSSFRSYIRTIPLPDTGKIQSILSVYFVSDKSVGDYTCLGSNKFGNSTGHMRLTNLYPTQNPPTIPVPTVRNVTQCCTTNKISGVCLEICKYDVDISMVIANTQKYESCLGYLSVYVSCATDGKDHSKCCTKNGVSDKCKPFCAGGHPDVSSEDELLLCITDVPTILSCVQEGVKHIPSPPLNVNARIDSDNFIQVYWDAPMDNANNLTHYVLHVNRTGVPKGTLEYKLDKKLRSFRIKDAKEGDEFQFYVIAESSEGNSQPSFVKNFTFKNVKPAMVKNFSVKVINGNNAQLSWSLPQNKAIVSKYVILYGPSKGTKTKITKAKTDTTLELTNLKPNTKYDFSIEAYGYGSIPLASDSTTRAGIMIGQSSTGTGKQTGDEKSRGSGANVGLGIGLTVLILLLVGGAAVATFLYCRRQRKGNLSQAVSFENPQYGSRVQISGLPDSHHDNQEESFGYAPLREDTDVEHSPVKAHEAARLDLNQAT